MGEDPELRRIMEEKMKAFLDRRSAEDSQDNEQDGVIGDGVIDVGDSDFAEKILRANLPAVVDFWASWCGPCRYMEPAFRRVAARHKGKMIFGRLNVDANRTTAMAYFVMSIPTMLIFRDGEEKGGVVGAVSEQKFESAITPYISG